MAILRKKVVWGSILGAVVLVGLAVAGILIIGWRAPAEAGKSEAEKNANHEEGEVVVTVIEPRQDPHFRVAVEEIATVRAYYRANIEARVAGSVLRVPANINDLVKKNDVLVEINVPDLRADVAAKNKIIIQRDRETELARRQYQASVAAAKVAKTGIDQRTAEWQAAKAFEDYHHYMLDRFTASGQKNLVTPSVVEEQKKDYEAAREATISSRAAIDKATAEYEQALINSEAVKADIDLKEALHEVAIEDRNKAQALLSFATLIAPFDGVIVDRHVDPGDFVQNASTAHSSTLISVARVDMVTIAMEVPDNYAPYVKEGDEAEIDVGDLVAHGKVTRYSPSIENQDRNMHVEVDLFNSTRKDDYTRFVRRHRDSIVLRLGVLGLMGSPFGQGPMLAASGLCPGRSDSWAQLRKGKNDPFPVLPTITGKGARTRQYPFLPGMVGKMRLYLTGKLDTAWLVPSNAVFLKAGKTFIATVVDDKVMLREVEVQVDDGTLAKVALVLYQDVPGGERERLVELSGKEHLIVPRSGQALREFKDGQTVKPELKKW